MIESQCSREIDDGAFGGVVGEMRPVPAKAGYRCNVDYRAARGNEVRDGFPRQKVNVRCQSATLKSVMVPP